EALRRASPEQIVYGAEHGNIDPKCRESAKQQRLFPRCEKGLGEAPRSRNPRIPMTPIFRKVFQVRILRENSRRGLGSPSGYSGVAVPTAAYDGQIVRNRRRLDSEFCAHATLVAESLASAVHLHDSRAHHALAEIFVGGADNNLPNAIILSCFRGS